jgi:TonB family protein
MTMIFLLKLTLAWGLFALLYALLLRRETFFRANRAYLLGSAVIGILFALPFDWLAIWQSEIAAPAVILPAVTVGLQQAEEATKTWHWLDYLWFAYWAGAGVALLRMSWGLFRIMRMAARGDKERLADGCVLIKTAEAKVPFSFFNWVFVPQDEKEELDSSRMTKTDVLMLAHERAHAHDWHSVDVLFAELLCVAFWFHPLSHWYRRALRTVHEYLADAEASRLTDRKQYGLLLIRQAQSGVSLAFVNHFFQSPLKQRLIMLTQNASPALRAWKYGLALPVFALLFLLACQKTASEQNDSKAATEQTAIDRTATSGKDVFELFDVEQPPQFPGGQEALIKFLSENIKYPDAARSESAEGMAVVTFVVAENGAIEKAEGIKMDGEGWRQDFQDEAVRVVQSMPNWEPAVKNGKPVKVKFTLPVKFKLK